MLSKIIVAGYDNKDKKLDCKTSWMRELRSYRMRDFEDGGPRGVRRTTFARAILAG